MKTRKDQDRVYSRQDQIKLNELQRGQVQAVEKAGQAKDRKVRCPVG
jgi:hypothetical protein